MLAQDEVLGRPATKDRSPVGAVRTTGSKYHEPQTWENQDMTDKPKFEVIDRRKMKAEEEEQQGHRAPEPPEPGAGPHLVVNESHAETTPEPPLVESAPEQDFEGAMPPAPTAQESREQNDAYQASAERVEDLLRAQNPGMGKQPVGLRAPGAAVLRFRDDPDGRRIPGRAAPAD